MIGRAVKIERKCPSIYRVESVAKQIQAVRKTARVRCGTGKRTVSDESGEWRRRPPLSEISPRHRQALLPRAPRLSPRSKLRKTQHKVPEALPLQRVSFTEFRDQCLASGKRGVVQQTRLRSCGESPPLRARRRAFRVRRLSTSTVAVQRWNHAEKGSQHLVYL